MVREAIADHRSPATFFCGGSRNFRAFQHLFDVVFVLQIDRDTLARRLAARSGDVFGADASERELVLLLYATGEDAPHGGIAVDATAPLDDVDDQILRLARITDAESGIQS